jgi:hypothetical protein
MKEIVGLSVFALALSPLAAAAEGFPKGWDRNGDGVVSLREGKLAKLTPAQFKASDANSDGKIDLEEFHALIVAGIPDAPKSPYAPSKSQYADVYRSDFWRRLESGETFILHRVIRDCVTDKALPEKMEGRREIVWKIGAKIGYVNAACQARKEEQCVLDGTKDQYYDEWCETLDLKPIQAR